MELYDPQDLLSVSLSCIEREFPYYLQHAVDAPMTITRPRELHPAFFGCSDWHSAVHNHWLLIRLRREFPELEGISEAERILDEHLSPAAIGTELAYFDDPLNAEFSRPYGWAWVLRLHAEAATTPGAERWATAVAPLRDELASRMRTNFGSTLQFPIRTGLHSNTAFAMAFGLDSARLIGDTELADALASAALRMFAGDRDYPLVLEPSGGDFHSPALTEAALLASVLPPREFAAWLSGFLPTLNGSALLDPPQFERNNADPATVHLNGLLLTKACSLVRIAAALPADDERRSRLEESALAHWKAAQDALIDRHYHAIHWIPTFTVLAQAALRDAGLI